MACRFRSALLIFLISFLGVVELLGSSGPASAQSSTFCPSSFTLINGFCVSQSFTTKPVCPVGMGPVSFAGGGFACVGNSSAAAASQSLSTTQTAIANQSMLQTEDIVRSRQQTAMLNCPAGMVNINGICRPAGTGRAMGYSEDDDGIMAYAAAPGQMLLKAPKATVAGLEVHPAAWVQGFYDYENRDQTTGTANVVSATGAPGTLLPPGGLTTSTSLGQTTQTGGFLTGLDFTFKNFSGSDVLLVGLLGGYASSHVTFSHVSNTSNLFGPSVGAFAIYAHNAFSTDVVFKTDFKTLDQEFADFTSGGAFAVSGTASTRLNIYSVAGNVNYKIPLNDMWYVEPTAGAIYTAANYDSSAAALGLADSTSTRLQGGSRFGVDWNWDKTVVNTTLTGLVYSNVSVTGGTVTSAAFASPVIPNDQGLVFGQILLVSIFDFHNGFSVQLGTDVRFAENVFGIGANARFRYQW